MTRTFLKCEEVDSTIHWTTRPMLCCEWLYISMHRMCFMPDNDELRAVAITVSCGQRPVAPPLPFKKYLVPCSHTLTDFSLTHKHTFIPTSNHDKVAFKKKNIKQSSKTLGCVSTQVQFPTTTTRTWHFSQQQQLEATLIPRTLNQTFTVVFWHLSIR